METTMLNICSEIVSYINIFRTTMIMSRNTAGYLGADMFIMRRVDNRELSGIAGPALNAYNKKHAGRRIKVEWGIGGITMKWRILNRTFRARRVKFGIVVKACCILTNFLHRRRMNFRMEDLGNARGGA